MASYDSTDGIDYRTHISWETLSPEKRQIKINQSRNYIRYRIAKGWMIPCDHPMLTPEERIIIEFLNDTKQAVTNAKIAFFENFYKNCPKVGSTLKRKEKLVKDPLEDLIDKI